MESTDRSICTTTTALAVTSLSVDSGVISFVVLSNHDSRNNETMMIRGRATSLVYVEEAAEDTSNTVR